MTNNKPTHIASARDTSLQPTIARKVLLALCATGFVFMALVCVAVVLIDKNVPYTRGVSCEPALPNVILAAVFVAACMVGFYLRPRISARSARHFTHNEDVVRHHARWYTYASYVLPLLLLLFQVCAYYVAGINTGWDASVLADVSLFPKGEYGEVDWYFASFPNNQFLLWVFRGLEELRGIVAPMVDPKSFFAYSACLASSVSFALFIRIARSLMPSEKSAMVASLVYGALVGLSPWFMIPYSDTYGLLFCTLLLWCVACGRSNAALCFVFGFLTAIGYAIKPTVLFAFVAAPMCTVLALGPWDGKRRYVVVALALACVGFGTGWCATHFASKNAAVNINENGAFGAWHYVMMGLNDETDGMYLESDVEYSKSFAMPEERTDGNKRVIAQRLQDLGAQGLAFHELKKLLICFNDGTFAWAGEGNFYNETRSKGGWLSTLISNVYYTDKPGYVVFQTVQQLLWVAVLLGIPLGIFGIKRLGASANGHELIIVATMLASIVALALFVLVFEARARYLYLYGGSFVLLAVWGYVQGLARIRHSTSSLRH